MAALGALVLASVAGLSRSSSVSAADTSQRHLWDPSRRLSARDAATLEERLAVAKRRVGSPIYVFITNALKPQETAAAMAERIFAERALGGSESFNPVLLLVALHDNQAAIATGKGNAGIIPEIDATRITSQLMGDRAHQPLGVSLARAIEKIVSSAEETTARRRPLSPQEADVPPAEPHAPPAPVSPGSVPDDAPANRTVPPSASPSSASPTAAVPARRSRLPIAVGIAAILLLALALRRRHSLAAARRELAAAAPASSPEARPPPPNPNAEGPTAQRPRPRRPR